MNKVIYMLLIVLIGAAFAFAGGQPEAASQQEEETVTLEAATGIQSREISYTVDGKNFIGYLAWDAGISQARPGIIVVHEWLGINEYAKKRADDLAKEGYVAFALDMYGDGKTIPMSEARAMSGTVGSDFPLIQARFNTALELLKNQELVDADKIAAIGYCFGGGIVLNMARMGTDIDGVVSFHGSLNTGLTAGAGDIRTKVLAFQGEGDPAAPAERRDAFVAEMEASGADYEYVVYENVNAHNFTNPEGSTYYEKEAEMAWDQMLEFFNGLF
ncbi:MAG: dienelactone hydrolase family protein [Spirochaetales bacterium]|nr:dienelactone hydrolase family protein [Spirochaetales bacterium]